MFSGEARLVESVKLLFEHERSAQLTWIDATEKFDRFGRSTEKFACQGLNLVDSECLSVHSSGRVDLPFIKSAVKRENFSSVAPYF